MPRETIPCSTCGKPAELISINKYRKRYLCRPSRHLTFVYLRVASEKRIQYFKCYNHQGKASALVDALSNRFVFETNNAAFSGVKFMLSDSDVAGRLTQLMAAKRSGVNRFFIYPHSARPSIYYNFYPQWEHTTAQFVVTDHHAEVLRACGYNGPIHSIGWFLSPIRPFVPTITATEIDTAQGRPLNVLFAPIHPKNAPADRAANRKAFDALYPHVLSGEITLKVRYIGALIDSGVPQLPGPAYIRGEMNQGLDMIERADVVIAHQTYAYLAVAVGVPCVMFGEDVPAHVRRGPDKYEDLKSWESIKPLIRFPLELFDGLSDIIGMLRRACASDRDIREWKARMIGEPMDPKKLIETVEAYL